MAAQNNCLVEATVTPVAVAVAAANDGVSHNADSIFIKAKIKLKLFLPTGEDTNATSSTAFQFKPQRHREKYALSRNDLKSDNAGDSTSRSWTDVSKIVSDIAANAPFELVKVHWKDQKKNIVLEDQDHDQLVALVLQEARLAAATSEISGLYLRIKKVAAFVNHDTFVDFVHGLDQRTRVQEILDEWVSRLRPPVDSEAVKKEIVASFRAAGVVIGDRELGQQVARVLERVCVTE